MYYLRTEERKIVTQGFVWGDNDYEPDHTVTIPSLALYTNKDQTMFYVYPFVNENTMYNGMCLYATNDAYELWEVMSEANLRTGLPFGQYVLNMDKEI